MECKGVRLSSRVLYKKRYGSWFLIDSHRAGGDRLSVGEGADIVLLELLNGKSLTEVAVESGYSDDEVTSFVGRLVDEGLVDWDFSVRGSADRCYDIDPPLDGINLLITNKCNLRCAHCYVESGSASTAELDGGEWVDVLEQARALGVFEVNVSGGEPLAHRDFETIAAHIASVPQFHANLNTNGTMIADRHVGAISAAFASVQISLDDSSPERHDAFRGRSGSFARSLNSIRRLIAAGVETNVGFTITPGNLGSLDTMVDFCEASGVTSLHVGIVADVGRARANGLLQISRRQDSSDDLTGRLYERLKPLAEYHGRLKLLLPFRLRQAEKAGTDKVRVCSGDATQIVYVMPDGSVMPCDKLPAGKFTCGNVRDASLFSAWTSSAMTSFKCRRLEDLGRCGACSLRQLCGGACPARAYHESGSLDGSDTLACRMAHRFASDVGSVIP
jgi:radical SAM protein with 4Fe4S-binding SPASM domain